MFNPRGVAVFGAVHETGKFGRMVIQSLRKYGYEGQIYPICPGGGEVLGLKVYDSLQKVGGPVVLLLKSLGVTLPTFLEMDGLPVPSLDQYLDGLVEAGVRLRESTGKDLVMVMENRANLPTDVSLEGASRAIQVRYHSSGVPVYPSVKRALRAIRNASKKKKGDVHEKIS